MRETDPTIDDAYEVTTDASRVDPEAAAALLRTTSWAADLTAADLARAIERSITAVAIERRGGRLVGLARAVSDGVTFAYLTDVVVREAHRGRGLARRLSEALLSHPGASAAKHWALLASHERVGMMYADLGFARTAHQHAWMELFRR